MSSPVSTVSKLIDEIEYPVSDGEPMAETPTHRDNLSDSIFVLRGRFAARRDVYVSGNMFVYYEEGDVRKHVSPDVFLVEGVPDVERDCYKTWEEPKPTIDFITEYTSKSTAREDQRTKFDLFRDRLNVREYVLFDPYEEYLDPPEQMFRLVNGVFVPVDAVDGRLPSEVLGLHLERRGRYLRFYDPGTGLFLPTPAEIEQQRDLVVEELANKDQALQSALHESRRKDAEIERLQRQMEQLRGGTEASDNGG